MTHEEIKILVSAYIDGETNPSEKNIVEEHLRTCASCRQDYKKYMAMSSSLSQWSDETLSPDEEINVQKRFEQRREPMFTKRNVMAVGTTLALAIMITSVVQVYTNRTLQARVHDASVYLQGNSKSAAEDIAIQYSDNNSAQFQNKAYQQSIYGNVLQGRLKSAADDVGDQYSDGRFAKAVQIYAPQSMAVAQSTQYEPYFYGSQQKVVLAQNVVPIDTEKKEFLKNDHKVITNESMTLEVPDAQKTQNEIDALVSKFDGITINFYISKLQDGSRRGLYVFKVLPKNLKSLLHEIRKLGEVQAENQSGEDITDQYDYLQSRLESFEAAKVNLSKVLARNINNVDNNINIQAQLNSVEYNIAALEGNIKQFDDQSFMATVVVNFYDVVKPAVKAIVKPLSFKDQFIVTLKNNFKSTLQTSYEIGINSFSGLFIVLTFLLHVVLWSFIIFGVYLLIKWMLKK